MESSRGKVPRALSHFLNQPVRSRLERRAKSAVLESKEVLPRIIVSIRDRMEISSMLATSEISVSIESGCLWHGIAQPTKSKREQEWTYRSIAASRSVPTSSSSQKCGRPDPVLRTKSSQ